MDKGSEPAGWLRLGSELSMNVPASKEGGDVGIIRCYYGVLWGVRKKRSLMLSGRSLSEVPLPLGN